VREDILAVEEPLEIRVGGRSMAITMRTPGHDVELALGFLVSEGVISSADHVWTARYCAGATAEEGNTYNVLDISLAHGVAPPDPSLARQFYTTSSCGLCGKASIDAVRTRSAFDVHDDPLTIDARLLATFPDVLRAGQEVFEKTGGLHAAGLFDGRTGELLVLREDVGRHNAVDKVVGWALNAGRLPARGLVLMVSGRASFELVQKASMAGIPMLAAFFLWEWYHPNPIVDVRLLKNRNFGTAVSFSFVLGMVLFGSTVLIPEFLQSSLGYTAELAGLALSPAGFVLMFMMLVAGRLTATKIDPRLLICIGFLGTAFALRLMTNIYLQIDFATIVLLRCFQVIFMPLIFIPISTLNYVGVPREKNNQVSGISSFMRNIGGSIGTSGLSVFLTRQNQAHQVSFASHTSMGDPNFRQFLNGLTALFVSQGFDAATAAKKALAMAYFTVQSQANALSFKNSFFVMSVVIACLSPLPFIMRRPKFGERQSSIGH